MRPLASFAALAALSLASPAGAQEPSAGVLAAVRQLDASIVAKDATALERLLAPDFVGGVPTGAAYRRAEYIAFHCAPSEGLLEILPDAAAEPVVRVFEGRFAVVNRRVAVKRRAADGSVDAFLVQRIEALVRGPDGWRLVSGQGTRVLPPPPPR